MAGPLDDSDTRAAVEAALGAEHAAVWSYGLATAFLASGDQTALAEAALAHRERRDELVALCEAGGVAPVPAAAAYGTPRPVTDAASAAALLVVAEDDTAVGWRAVLERTDDAELRRSGVAAVVSAATVGVRWRRLAGTAAPRAAVPRHPLSAVAGRSDQPPVDALAGTLGPAPVISAGASACRATLSSVLSPGDPDPAPAPSRR